MAEHATAEWLAARLGTRKWVLARRSPRLVAKGYTVFISRKHWAALQAEYRATR